MKTTLKILLFAVALVVMTGCSSQKRAERHVRKAVALCPELVQMTAHPIDTVLTAPGYADCAVLSLTEVLKGETLYAATDHGTVVVSLRQSDSALRVGFVAAPQEIHFRDTLRYAKVILPNQPKDKDGTWGEFLAGAVCFFLGIAMALYLLFKKEKQTNQKHKKQ